MSCHVMKDLIMSWHMTHDLHTVYGLMLQVYKASVFTFMSWLQTGTELRAGEWLELCWGWWWRGPVEKSGQW